MLKNIVFELSECKLYDGQNKFPRILTHLSTRCSRLYILREENRQEHLSKMEKLRKYSSFENMCLYIHLTIFCSITMIGYDFVAKLREEKSRSDKEWKVMKKQLESVQDDKKGIGSLESTIRAMMWN